MISYFQPKYRNAVLFISFMVISICCALTYPQQTERVNKNDYYQNKAAKTWSDSLDFVLNRVKQSLGATDIDLTLGVIRDGHIFLKKKLRLFQS